MKMSFFFIIVAAVVVAALIAGCKPQAEQAELPKQPIQPHENVIGCSSDSDCGVGGCSGQVCTTAAEAPGLITTCEYRAEYDCLKMTSCGCIEGKCAWRETTEYKVCLDSISREGNI